ncbi:MAG: PAS domain-containing protein, partial [Cryomorphaceae bacterium]
MNRLKTVVRTESLQLESIMIEVEDEISTDEEYQIIRAKLENSLTNVNRVNELEDGLSFILIRNKDNLTEIISSGKTAGPDYAGVYVQSILESLPIKPIEKGLDESTKDESLFYAYPITLPGFSSYKGYLYVQESIGDELYQAKKILLQRLFVVFIIITLMAIFGKKYIKVILRQEVLAENKLKEYATLADNRNKELERLSFVLGKSEQLILLTDPEGKIEWINQENKGANNYSAEELSGFIGREVAEVSRYPKIKDAIETVNRTRKKYIYETKDFDEEMQEFWSSTTITPILNDDGEVDNLLFVDADVSRLKKAEQEISKLANFAQENTHALMRFRKNGEV